MATKYASNGYLRIGGQAVTKALKIQIKSSANVDMIMTLVGEVGFTSPNARAVQISCDNAVAKGDVERKAIYQKYQAGEILGLTYTSGSTQFKFAGVINSTDLGSETNKADTFNFEITGVEEPVQ
jgi:hypothetical protein